MLRERAAGTYYVSSYFLAKSTIDMIVQILSPIVFSFMVYFFIGYQITAGKFFKYLFFMILDTYAATSLATAVSCCCVSIELSTVILSAVFEVSRLYGGFFTSPVQLLEHHEWKFIDSLSYIKYTFVGVALNELEGLELSCTASEVAAKTCIASGEEIMTQKGYDQYSIGFCAGMLLLYIFICRLFGYLALRFIKV